MNWNAELLEAAREGERWLRTPGAPDLPAALPYIQTSARADAWIIGAWATYWRGKAPDHIRASRGHWYAVDCCGIVELVTVTRPDHRDGVTVKGGGQ